MGAIQATHLHNGQRVKTSLCAIYTRKSTEEGLDGDFSSLDSQREYCQAFIKSREPEGWVVYPDQYDDGGFSGGNTNRPALKRLLADAREGKFQVVVCYKYDRLSRNTKDFLQILEVFDRNGVAFVSVTQPIDTTSSVGRLMRSILMDFSQFEREMIAERTRDKLHAMAKRGKRTGGQPIIGYNIDSENRSLKVNPEEKIQVIDMFETYIRTKSLSTTATLLNEKGYRMKSWITHKGTPKGGQKLNKANLWYLLQNPLYIGKITHRREVLPGEHEAILPEELFNQAQELLKINGDGKKYRRIEARKHTFLLRGLVRCACCNTAMTPYSCLSKKTTYRQRFFYYKCLSVVKGTRTACKVRCVSAEALEAFVIRRLEDLSKNQQIVDQIVKDGQALTDSVLPLKADEKKRLSAEKGRVQLEIETLMGVVTREGVESKAYSLLMENLGKLKERRDELEAGLAGLELEIRKLEEQQIDGNLVRRNLGNFVELFKRLTDDERMELVALMVKQVTWDGLESMVTLELRPAKKLFGDLNLLDGVSDYRWITLPGSNANHAISDYRQVTLPASNANQTLPDQRQTPAQLSNGNQNQNLKNNLLFVSNPDQEGSITILDRCKVGFLRVAKGKAQILYPAESNVIKSRQRRYKVVPNPRPPTIQILLKQAYQLNKTLEENPSLTRSEVAKRFRIEPTMLTRMLNLLNLAPEIQRHILQMEPSIYQSPISERRIAHLARSKDHQFQMAGFKKLTAIKPRARISTIQENAQRGLVLTQLSGVS